MEEEVGEMDSERACHLLRFSRRGGGGLRSTMKNDGKNVDGM